jgi:hypothetical protein
MKSSNESCILAIYEKHLKKVFGPQIPSRLHHVGQEGARIKTLRLKYDMSLILDVTNVVYDLGMIHCLCVFLSQIYFSLISCLFFLIIKFKKSIILFLEK